MTAASWIVDTEIAGTDADDVEAGLTTLLRQMLAGGQIPGWTLARIVDGAEPETFREIISAVREADQWGAREGGGTRAWTERLLELLAERGLTLTRTAEAP